MWDAVVAELADTGYTVELVRRCAGATWNGQTSFAHRTVRVHDDLEAPQRLKTLFHEWAHTAMNHENRTDPAARHVVEVEAESVAYLLCGNVGVDSQQYTVPYVSGWAGSVDVVKATAERVLGTASKLVDRLETRLDVDLTPDRLALAQTQPAIDVGADRLERAADRLLDAERRELLGCAAPERVAVLLAAAGFDVNEAAQTFRQLGIDQQIATIAMTAINPYTTVDRDAEPLYDPAATRAALTNLYPPPTPSDRHGLELIHQWTRIINGPPVEIPVPTR